jgi:RNA polymerase sigma factor (sigma-70 family)
MPVTTFVPSPATLPALPATVPALQWTVTGELFCALSPRLERIVRGGVRAPEPVIEDACQSAWKRLIDHSDRVSRERALAWLATTALHEALRLAGREQREVSLEELAGTDGPRSELPRPVLRSRGPGPHELVELRDRLGALGGLPERQRRLLWMHAFGFTYEEMSRETGCSRRTVERQLLRAKRRARVLAAH